MKNILNFIALICFISLVPKPAKAVSYPRTKVCGEVKKVDLDKGEIEFLSYSKNEVLRLKVGRLSSFIKDDTKSSLESVPIGTPIELIYKSPLFSDRYVVILRWVTQGELDSQVCEAVRKGGVGD